MIKMNTDVNDNEKLLLLMKTNIIKSKIRSSDTKIFIQNSNKLCTSCFHYLVGLLSVIADVRLILEDN